MKINVVIVITLSLLLTSTIIIFSLYSIIINNDSALHKLACAHEHYHGGKLVSDNIIIKSYNNSDNNNSINNNNNNEQESMISSVLPSILRGQSSENNNVNNNNDINDNDNIYSDEHRKKLRKQYYNYVNNVRQLFNKYNKMIHVISHTHWDREWYLPFERFRRKFVWVFDEVLNRFHTKPNEMNHFHMDGQVIPYLDYFEIKPQRKNEIIDFINAGKLSIGPWYTAPDEFLASAEALARNLLNGYRHCRQLGVDCLPFGYGADNFGHISQLPQLYELFDIDTAIQARGVPANTNMEYLWRGADQTEILVIYMKHWYCHAEGSPNPGGSTMGFFRPRIQKSVSTSATKHALLMNGCDHTPMDANILDNIKILQQQNNIKQLNNAYVFQSDFNIFVDSVKKNLDDHKKKGLRVFNGEQRTGIAPLSHIASNKITQKQANWRCQTLLEHYVEPIRTIGWGKNWLQTYEMGFIWYAWESILQSHAHDSIGGCSVPEVHEDVDHRFKRCEQVATTLLDEGLQVLMTKTDLGGGGGKKIIVIDTLGVHRNNDPVIIRIDGNGGDSVIVKDEKGNKVASEVLRYENRVWDYLLPKNGFRRPWTGQRTYIGILASVKAFGTRVYTVEFNKNKPKLKTLDGILENKYLKIIINKKNGGVSVTDKTSKLVHDNMNILEIQKDNGDEYQSRVSGGIITADNVKLDTHGCYKGELGSRCHITASMKAPNGDQMPIQIHYFLGDESKSLDIRVSLLNRNNGFRLRSSSSINKIRVKDTLVDSHFDIVKRSGGSSSLAEAQQDFVSYVGSNGQSLTFANRGLPEYQSISNKYCLTLLRATGRMGDWGTFPSSPSSQEHGLHSFEYSIIFTKDTLEGQMLARQFNVPMIGVYAQNYPGIIHSRPVYEISSSLLYFLEAGKKSAELQINTYHNPADHSPRRGGGSPAPPAGSYSGKDALPTNGQYMSLSPNKLVLSAIKLSERRGKTLTYGPFKDVGKVLEDRGRSIIIRWYNPTDSSIIATLWIDMPVDKAYLCKMNEERMRPLIIKPKGSGKFVEIKTDAKKIITVEFTPLHHR